MEQWQNDWTARELAVVFDEIDEIDEASKSGKNEGGGDMEDDMEDEAVGGGGDVLPDEQDELSEEELSTL